MMKPLPSEPPLTLSGHEPGGGEGGGGEGLVHDQDKASKEAAANYGFQNHLELSLGMISSDDLSLHQYRNNNVSGSTLEEANQFNSWLNPAAALIPSAGFIHPWSLAARQQKAVFEQAHHNNYSFPVLPRAAQEVSSTTTLPPNNDVVGWPPVLRASRKLNLASFIINSLNKSADEESTSELERSKNDALTAKRPPKPMDQISRSTEVDGSKNINEAKRPKKKPLMEITSRDDDDDDDDDEDDDMIVKKKNKPAESSTVEGAVAVAKSINVRYSNSSTAGRMFVKVNMEGYVVARKIDLKAHHNYRSLSRALCKLCRNFLSNSYLINPEEEEDEVTDDDFILLYEDSEGDRMLVGDIPWELFITSAKKLYIAHNPRRYCA